MRLADWLACSLIALAGSNAYAQPWSFKEPVDITAPAKAGVFHHLESSGRRNIAVSANTVAVTWEDDRDGTPRIYLALKDKAAIKFAEHIQVSASGEAFEPGLVALKDGLFAVVWEEDEHVPNESREEDTKR